MSSSTRNVFVAGGTSGIGAAIALAFSLAGDRVYVTGATDAETLTSSQSTATITLRQWPSVSALDRVIHRQFNDTYIITGVNRQGPNTILQAKKFDDLIL